MENTTTLLLARWKAAKGITNDSAAARRLKLLPSAVNNWQRGVSHASPIYAEKMALDLGLDVLAVLCAIESDRAKVPAIQKVWARYGKGAFMGLLLGLGVQVAAVAAPPEPGHIAPHYAKWRKRVPFSQRSPQRRTRPRRRQPTKKRISGG